jgi:tetratricopeptide (TPR) repeat protein
MMEELTTQAGVLASLDAARDLRGRGEAGKAVGVYKDVLLQNPDLPGVWELLASALGELGDHSRAMECLDRALLLDRASERAWFERGAIFSRLGEHRQALKCFERVFRIRPGYPGLDESLLRCRKALSLASYDGPQTAAGAAETARRRDVILKYVLGYGPVTCSQICKHLNHSISKKSGMTVAELAKFLRNECPEVMVYDTVLNRNRYHLPLSYTEENEVSFIDEQIP